MSSNLQVWALTGLVAFLISVLLILFKRWITNSTDLTKAITDLKVETVRSSEQLRTLFERFMKVEKSNTDLEKRVRKLETEKYQYWRQHDEQRRTN